MIRLGRILRDYEESGAVSALVNVHAVLDEQMFLTKSGDLLLTLSVEGPDDECLEPAERDHIARRFESAVRTLSDGFRLYQFSSKRYHTAIPAQSYDHPVVQEAIKDRMAHFQAKPDSLCSIETHFVVVFEGWSRKTRRAGNALEFLKAPVRFLQQSFSNVKKADQLEKGMDEARETLRNKVTSFIVLLPDQLRVTIMDAQRSFHFLRGLLNYAPHKAIGVGVRLKYDRFVDFQACDSVLECYRDHLRLDDAFVQVLTLKEPPSRTFANVLRDLHGISCNYIIASEWAREDHAGMRRQIQSRRRHFNNVKTSLRSSVGSKANDTLVDDSAVGIVAELGSCIEEIELNGRAFGQFSMTLILYSDDLAVLKRSVAECFKVFAAHDALLTEERYNMCNAWFAVLPGNAKFNLRRFWLLDSNYADLSFLFSIDHGQVVNPHMQTEYLAVLETNQHTPYYLNLHYQDIPHTALLGFSGSGKSFLINFILTHVQKYRPLTFIFDLGGSYENLTRIFGGTYMSVGVESRSFTINPFSLPPTPENMRFLLAFVKVLIESDSFHMSSTEEQDLYEQLQNIYLIEPGQRRLLTLSNMLNRNLRARLSRWVEGGVHAAVFDNTEDSLSLASFQTFDFEGMDKVPDLLEALVFYILHRANALIYDPALTTTFKIFVMDEAWRFLSHPTIRLYILEALKTWRKKNAAMVLATQSSNDLMRSDMLPVVVESCPTKIFLANPDMDRNAYRDAFHLNNREVDLITGLIPKQQFLVKRPDASKVLNLHVTSRDYWLYTSNPQDRERRRKAFERYGFQEGLEILTRRDHK